MKKWLLTVSLLCLTGCASKDPNAEFKAYMMNNYSDLSYESDYSDMLLSEKSSDFSSLEDKLYRGLQIEDIQFETSDTVSVTFSVDSLDEISKLALNDTSGYVSDIHNLVSTKASKEVLIDYTCKYFCAVGCDVRKSFTVALIADKADKVFSVNSAIINYLCEDISTVVNNTIASVSENEVTYSESSPDIFYKEFALQDIILLTYTDDSGSCPVTIKFTDIQSGVTAENTICGLSKNNKHSSYGTYQLYYYTYEVTNYSNVTINFKDMFGVYDNFCKLNYEDLNYFGLNSIISISPGETALVKNACIGTDNCSLIWCADSVNLAYGIKLSN